MLFFKVVSLFGMTLGGPWACSCVDFHKKLFKKDGKGCWKLMMIGYQKSVVPTSILSIPFTQLIELIDAQLFSSFLLSDKVCHFLLSRRCSLDVPKLDYLHQNWMFVNWTTCIRIAWGNSAVWQSAEVEQNFMKIWSPHTKLPESECMREEPRTPHLKKNLFRFT